ncbi:MAG: HdeD family acid-resistance protein [Thermodesulfobacteriota bacterium]
MLRGVLAGVLGICALVWPTAGLGIITALVGIYCLADGISGLVGAMRVSDRGSYLLQALFGIVVGLILLAWPRESIRILLMFFGAWALFTGISQIITARRADADFTERGPMTAVGQILAVVGLVLIVWPGTGVVTISWVIAIALLLIAGLLIFLAVRLKRLKERVDKLTVPKPKTG